MGDPVSMLNAIAFDAVLDGIGIDKMFAGLKYFIHTYENMLHPDFRVAFLQKQNTIVRCC
jgi:hypothetical protein